MAQNSPQSDVWVNPLPLSVDADMGIILNSLTTWLANPTFLSGVTVGNGTMPTYDPSTGAQTAPAPKTLVSLNAVTQAPTDTSTPGTPTVTAVGGIRSILAYWPAVLTANGSAVQNYVAEVASDSGFTSIVETLNPVGPVVSFDNLTPNTTYYVRVAAVSYAAVQGLWSTTVTVTTPQISTADIAANTITAASAIIATAAISNAQIASITADKIQAGTINAQTIQLGATGGTAAVQSTNYVAGSAGWSIKGDGSAEFQNATLDGSLTTGPATGEQIVLSGGVTTLKYNGVTQGTIGPTGSWGNTGIDIVGFDGATKAEIQMGTAVVAGATGGGSTLNLDGGSISVGTQALSVGGKIFLGQSGVPTTVTGGLSADTAKVGGKGVATGASTTSPVIQSGFVTVTPGAGGVATITYPTAFSTSSVAVAQVSNGSGAYWIAEVVNAGTTTFQVVVITAAGAPKTSGSVAVSWIAVGT